MGKLGEKRKPSFEPYNERHSGYVPTRGKNRLPQRNGAETYVHPVHPLAAACYELAHRQKFNLSALRRIAARKSFFENITVIALAEHKPAVTISRFASKTLAPPAMSPVIHLIGAHVLPVANGALAVFN